MLSNSTTHITLTQRQKHRDKRRCCKQINWHVQFSAAAPRVNARVRVFVLVCVFGCAFRECVLRWRFWLACEVWRRGGCLRAQRRAPSSDSTILSSQDVDEIASVCALGRCCRRSHTVVAAGVARLAAMFTVHCASNLPETQQQSSPSSVWRLFCVLQNSRTQKHTHTHAPTSYTQIAHQIPLLLRRCRCVVPHADAFEPWCMIIEPWHPVWTIKTTYCIWSCVVWIYARLWAAFVCSACDFPDIRWNVACFFFRIGLVFVRVTFLGKWRHLNRFSYLFFLLTHMYSTISRIWSRRKTYMNQPACNWSFVFSNPLTKFKVVASGHMRKTHVVKSMYYMRGCQLIRGDEYIWEHDIYMYVVNINTIRYHNISNCIPWRVLVT